MTPHKTSQTGPKHLPEIGDDLTREEIMDVLADEGYSAGDRKGWLKKVLTRIAQAPQDNPDADREALVREIKRVLDRNIPGEPEADDTL